MQSITIFSSTLQGENVLNTNLIFALGLFFLKLTTVVFNTCALKRLFLIWKLLYHLCLNCYRKSLLLPLSFWRIILRWKHVQHKLNSSSWTIFLKIDHCAIQHMGAQDTIFNFISLLLELFKEVSVKHLLIPSNHLEVKCAQPRLNSCSYTIFL